MDDDALELTATMVFTRYGHLLKDQKSAMADLHEMVEDAVVTYEAHRDSAFMVLAYVAFAIGGALVGGVIGSLTCSLA